MKNFVKLLAVFVIISLGLLLYISYSYNKFVNSMPDDKGTIKIVDIRPGESAVSILRQLEKESLITSSRKFYYYAKLHNKLPLLKFGEYEFNTSMKPAEILQKLVEGDVRKYKLTIPEGFNLNQIGDAISTELKKDKDDFLKKAFDAKYVRSLGLYSISLEGYLFPDTYYFTKDSKVDDIIKKMYSNYKLNFTERMKERASELNMSEHAIVTLASIIEKETSKRDEMPLISAVFHNRLKKNMRLQSDPTTIYGIKDFNGNLTKKDLETHTFFNTYKIKGLPPTPIASPGLAALKAALYPNKVDYLYFVSKNNGEHYFSNNFDEHSKAVYTYQIKREKPKD